MKSNDSIENFLLYKNITIAGIVYSYRTFKAIILPKIKSINLIKYWIYEKIKIK